MVTRSPRVTKIAGRFSCCYFAVPNLHAATGQPLKKAHVSLVAAWPPGEDRRTSRLYGVPWREEGPPESEWIDAPGVGLDCNFTRRSNLLYFFRGDQLIALRFDARARRFERAPFPVGPFPGSEPALRPSDRWGIGGHGIVFARSEPQGSIWLMKVPE